MLYAFLALLIGFLVYTPQLWVRFVMAKHAKERAEIPGTGAELARHLIKRFDLDVQVEQTAPFKDHYDPGDRTVRLSPRNFNGRSLTAIAVAAHEVGHAIQFERHEDVSNLRAKYLPIGMRIKQIGSGLIMAGTLMLAVVHVPNILLLSIIAGIVTFIASAATYLFVLPEEYDASFAKALPILSAGEYIEPQHQDAVRQVLKAAALTYVCAALADVLSVWRWIGFLRGIR